MSVKIRPNREVRLGLSRGWGLLKELKVESMWDGRHHRVALPQGGVGCHHLRQGKAQGALQALGEAIHFRFHALCEAVSEARRAHKAGGM